MIGLYERGVEEADHRNEMDRWLASTLHNTACALELQEMCENSNDVKLLFSVVLSYASSPEEMREIARMIISMDHETLAALTAEAEEKLKGEKRHV